jgi:hypothetical protein
VDCYERDEARVREGTTPDSALSKQAVELDKFTVMNSPLSKAPFQENSLKEMSTYVGQELGCLEEMMSAKRNFKSSTEKFLTYLTIMKRHDKPSTVAAIKRAMQTLEYAIHVHVLFIDGLMNKTKNITLANIDEQEKVMKESLEYFQEWYEEQEMFKNGSNEADSRGTQSVNASSVSTTRSPSNASSESKIDLDDEEHSSSQKSRKKKEAPWKRHFLADQTYLNIRIGVVGFFSYARAVLNLPNGPKYIPVLHSNQSSLEALFSWIRFMGRDTVSRFGAGVAARNAINTVNYQHVLHNNKMYDRDEVGLEKEDLLTEQQVGGNLKRRRDVHLGWLLNRPPETPESTEEPNETIFPPSKVRTDTVFGAFVLDILEGRSLGYKHFSSFLLSDTVFKEFAQMTVDTKSEDWSGTLCRGMTEENEDQFDNCCHYVLNDLWDCLDRSVAAGKSSVNSSYHFHVLSYMQGPTFQKIIESMPQGMKERHGSCFVCLTLSRLLLQSWIPEALEEIRNNLSSPPEEAAPASGLVDRTVRSKEVNRFFGWAIHSMVKRYKKKLIGGKDGTRSVDEDTVRAQLYFLQRELRVFEHEILNNPTYLKEFYYPADRINNNGFLTLVHPKYISLGLDVMNLIADELNGKTIDERGNEAVKTAKTNVKNRIKDGVQSTFLDLCSGFDELTTNEKLEIFHGIVDKTMNARIGYEIRRYRSRRIQRGGDAENSTSFRTDIKVKSEKKKLKKPKRGRESK